MPRPASPLRSPLLLATLAALPGGFGCTGPAPGDPSPTVREMYAHFLEVGEVQTAVIQGRLDVARDAASRVAAGEPAPDLPDRVRPLEEELREAARITAGASGLEAAARGAAEMAAACADCHVAASAGPDFRIGAAPPEGPRRADHMLRHVWAADRMWEGLLAPSDALWTAGAAALEEAPLGPGSVPRAREVEPWARRVHELAAEARAAETRQEREDVYAELLTTCSACHVELGVGG